MRNVILSIGGVVLFGCGDVACAQVGPPLIGGSQTVTASSVKVTSVSLSGSVTGGNASWTGDGLFTATAAAGDTINIDYSIKISTGTSQAQVGSSSGSALLSATSGIAVTNTYSLTDSGTDPDGFYGIVGAINAGSTLTDTSAISHTF